MFVDIENFKSAIGVSRLPKEHITPDVCMQILKSTNNPVNIQHMLECIAEIIDDVSAYEQISFKNIVLATFERREQPYEVVKIGENIAERLRFDGTLRKLIYIADEKNAVGIKNLKMANISYRLQTSNAREYLLMIL